MAVALEKSIERTDSRVLPILRVSVLFLFREDNEMETTIEEYNKRERDNWIDIITHQLPEVKDIFDTDPRKAKAELRRHIDILLQLMVKN